MPSIKTLENYGEKTAGTLKSPNLVSEYTTMIAQRMYAHHLNRSLWAPEPTDYLHVDQIGCFGAKIHSADHHVYLSKTAAENLEQTCCVRLLEKFITPQP